MSAIQTRPCYPCVGGPLDGEDVIGDEPSFTMDLPDGYEVLGGGPRICKYVLARKKYRSGASALYYQCVRADEEYVSGQVLETVAVETVEVA